MDMLIPLNISRESGKDGQDYAGEGGITLIN